MKLNDFNDDNTREIKNIAATSFEDVPVGESEKITEIARLTVDLMKQRYANVPPLRNVHPKAHGCVKAEFEINSDLPAEFRKGLFKTAGKKYQSIIRFSNATAAVDADVNDGKASSRGFALKVLDVDDEVFFKDGGKSVQDFLMINLPVFAFADVEEYLQLTKIQLANNDDILPFFAPPQTPSTQRTLGIVGKITQTQVANPVDSEYFSASPFLFGKDDVAKFSVKPRQLQNTQLPQNPSFNYLREALTKTLDVNNGKTVQFDFRVQIRNSEELKIEDATFEWDEAKAPFVNVATITIKPQDFNSDERKKECEDLVLTPWHALKAHQPLGGINRLRKAAYIASSRLRKGRTLKAGNAQEGGGVIGRERNKPGQPGQPGPGRSR